MNLTITTQQGLEEILAEEVRQLGGQDVEVVKRAVLCKGDTAFLYKANLCLTTGLRVLKPIHHFKARNERIFYDRIRDVDWKKLFGINQVFAVHSVVSSEIFRHSRFMALKAKDAIVDQFRDHFGRRPNVSTYNPDLIVNIHIYEDECTISLDSSGEPLYKRGYKMALHEAPLNEVLAAALLRGSDFENFESFHDPMCGSGTLVTEALMMHTRVPANFYREGFTFMKWKDYDEVLYKEIREELESQIRAPQIQFSCSDISRKYMFATKKNLVHLPHGEVVTVMKSDFLKVVPTDRADYIIMNPPYDVRLESDDINQLYGDIGRQLKNYYTGSRACVFSGNLDALKFTGLKPSKKMNVMNGALPSRLHVYDMYEGSRK